jgi:hypothetical protein
MTMSMSYYDIDEESSLSNIVYYVSLFCVGFMPGLFVGYLLWG